MNKLFVPCILFALALLPFLSSCGKDPHDAFADDMTAVFDEMTGILSTIQDKAGAEKAAPRLEKVAAKMQELMKQGQALDTPDPDKKMDPERSKKIQESMRKYTMEMMRVSRIEGVSEVLQKAMSAMRPPQK